MSYLAQAGYPAAAWMAQSWLQGQQQGRTPVQNMYQLAQPEFGAGIDFPIWGITHDMDADFGPTFPHLRPEALGMGIVNGGIQQGGHLYAITGLPTGIVGSGFGPINSGTGNMVRIN